MAELKDLSTKQLMIKYKATITDSTIRAIEFNLEKERKEWGRNTIGFSGPFVLESKYRIYAKTWTEAYKWLLKRRQKLLREAEDEMIKRKNLLCRVLETPCPNLDGDGSCHVCALFERCIMKEGIS